MLESESYSISYWTSFFEIQEYLSFRDDVIRMLHQKYASSNLTIEGFLAVLQEDLLVSKEKIASLDEQKIRFYKVYIEGPEHEFQPFFEHELEKLENVIDTLELDQKVTIQPGTIGKLKYMLIRANDDIAPPF